MDDRELVSRILSDQIVRDAVTHLVGLMSDCEAARRRRGHDRDCHNARYEIVVTGRQVSSGYYQHVQLTTAPKGGEEARTQPTSIRQPAAGCSVEMRR
jgi:hypothetical protein